MSKASHARRALARALPAVVLVAVSAAHGSAQDTWAFATGNELGCTIDNAGNVCLTSDAGGGVWPVGTPQNLYIFDAGLQAAGIISADAGFAWAGDTVVASFYDPRNGPTHGSPISDVFDSRIAAHRDAWPSHGDIEGLPFATAFIEAGDPFAVVHYGQPFISEQDTWTLYWEGDPTFNAAREHPLGLAVEQRTLQWNAPEGVQSTIFIVYRVTNVSNLSGFRASMAETYFDGDLSAVPVQGWVMDSVFLGFAMDPDVTTNATENFTFAMPGFEAVGAYHATFEGDGFHVFPPELFYPPFFGNAPGLAASALLYADGDARSRLTSQLPDFQSQPLPGQLWRVLSGHFGQFETFACSTPDPIEDGWCYQGQTPRDAKFYQSVGPWSLAPGQSATVIFAMVTAPTVNTPEIDVGLENPPGIPRWAPGCDGDDLVPIELAAGWVETPVCPAPGEPLAIDSVVTVPGSLLHRIQVARAFVQTGFLEPFAPEAPDFHVIAGDESIVVTWSPSPTEDSDDPFIDVASDSASALFNPNYRASDVEGYRVYRSTDGVNFSLLAQYDYADTEFADYICEADPTWAEGDTCDDVTGVPINDLDQFNHFAERLLLFRPGDRRRIGPDQVAILDADTVSAGYPQLFDSGIPFVHVDNDVRNGFRYYYRVVAFDVNSSWSGPSSLESTSDTRSATPRTSLATAGAIRIELRGADGTPLDSVGYGTLDPATGRFTGPLPPTDAFEVVVNAFAPELLADTVLEIRVDSAHAGYLGGQIFLTMPDGSTQALAMPSPQIDADPVSFVLGELRIPANPEVVAAANDSLPDFAATVTVMATIGAPHLHSADADWAWSQPQFWGFPDPPETSHAGGSRWFTGADETVSAVGLAHGSIPAVTIFQPTPYRTAMGATALAPYTNPFTAANVGGDLFRRFYQTTWAVRRQADMEIRWGGVPAVFDVTHQVAVPFRTGLGASYGFLGDADDDGVLTFADFYYIPGLEQAANIGAMSLQDPSLLVTTPQVMQVDIDGDLDADGTGFALYIAGEPWIFLGSAPTSGVWTLRTHGTPIVLEEDGDYALAPFGSSVPAVPGLRIAIVSRAGDVAPDATAADLARVHAVPDPFYVRSSYGAMESGRTLRFVNLPARATLRIYSISGVLIDVIVHEDPSGGGTTSWDLRTRDGNSVASGVYFFHVTAEGGAERIGRFTVVASRDVE